MADSLEPYRQEVLDGYFEARDGVRASLIAAEQAIDELELSLMTFKGRFSATKSASLEDELFDSLDEHIKLEARSNALIWALKGTRDLQQSLTELEQ